MLKRILPCAGSGSGKPACAASFSPPVDADGLCLVALGDIIEHLGYGVRVIDADFTVRRINRLFTEMSGLAAAEVEGKKCWQVFQSPLCHTPECRLKRIADNGQPIQTELEQLGCGDSALTCTVATFPLRAPDGKLCGIIESFKDITEHRRLEEQVRESEDRYRVLVDLGSKIGEAVVMMQDTDGVEGRWVFVSDRWPLMTGYPREELLQMSMFELISPHHREAAKARYRSILSGQAIPGLVEASIIRRDGIEVRVELALSPATYQGQPASVAYIRDITRRKQAEAKLKESEERYRSLFDNVPVAIWELDYSEVKKHIDGLRQKGVTDFRQYFEDNPGETLRCFELRQIKGVNKAAVALWEADSKEQLAEGIVPLIQWGPTGLKRDRQNYALFAEGATTISYEHTEPTFRGNRKHLSVLYRIAPGHENDWKRVYGLFFDITDRVKAETELNAYKEHLEEKINEATTQLREEVMWRGIMQEKLEQLYKTETGLRKELEQEMAHRAKFLRTLVHELKTPMTPLIAASDYLVSLAGEGPLTESARHISTGAMNLSRRIDELLDLARGEMGSLSLRCNFFDLMELASEVAEYMGHLACRDEKVLRLELHGSPCRIWADEDRVRQVLLNLLDNAFKFSRKGGHVVLSVETGLRMMIVQVQDHGCGIGREQKALFEPHRRFSNNSERFSGLGLGLTLCKMFVELHGGRIWVESEPGRGSTFSFSLPRSAIVPATRGKKA